LLLHCSRPEEETGDGRGCGSVEGDHGAGSWWRNSQGVTPVVSWAWDHVFWELELHASQVLLKVLCLLVRVANLICGIRY
jgi:hypothetical protein